MPKDPDLNTTETLRRRFKARVAIGLSLARAYRFVVELEPFLGDGPDPFVEVTAVFRAWREALRNEDVEGALDAVERSWTLLEACRQRVISRDAAIEAYRVRWACEHAPLPHGTIDSLARFYRLLPFSTSSQSKYEYVLTRRLAGPLRPERKIASTEDLREAVAVIERSWGAQPLTVEEGEVMTITLALKSFAHEAAAQADAASFTTSALLRRFGSFKASIGQQLFDPRLSVAVVETNVAVLNVLNQLLADAGGQPLRGIAAVRATRLLATAAPVAFDSTPAPGTAAPPVPVKAEPEAEGVARRDHTNFLTGEIDLSGLEFVRPRRKGEPIAEPPAASPPPSTVPPGEPDSGELKAPTETAGEAEPVRETEPIAAPRPELRTGEVDLSGLEFVRRRRAKGDAAAPFAGQGSSVNDAEADVGAKDGEDRDEGRSDSPSKGADEALAARAVDVAQQPSGRAFELGKLEENAAIVDRYLTGPRSPEVWQLDLDIFLGKSSAGVQDAQSNAAERRRALELILTSDDLICARASQGEAPSPEYRAQVSAAANAMLQLRTSLQRSAAPAQGNAAELEPVLYVADHLLWERLRLEASLKRKPSRRRPLLLPRTNRVAEAALVRTQILRRHRRILVRLVAVAAVVTILVGWLSSSAPAEAVDPEVSLVQVAGLPGVDLFDDARRFRTTLFVSVSRTWVLLGREERRSIVRGLGAFAADRGLDAVSVIGPSGEPWATFKDDEVLLDGELTAADLARR